MLKNVIASCLMLTLAVAASSHSATPADARARVEYLIDFTSHAKHNVGANLSEVTTKGTLRTEADREASFLMGGDIKTADPIVLGLSLKIKIQQLEADKLKVVCYLSQSDIDSQNESELIVKESGVHCVTTIKPGDTISLDLGEGRTAEITIRVSPAK